MHFEPDTEDVVFVTRLNETADYGVAGHSPVPSRSVVQRDEIVFLVAMLQQQIQQQIGTRRIILGARWIECLAPTGGHRRRHQEQMQGLILATHEHQSSTRLLHRHGEGTIGESLTQPAHPSLHGFRGSRIPKGYICLKTALVEAATAAWIQAAVVAVVREILLAAYHMSRITFATANWEASILTSSTTTPSLETWFIAWND